MLLQEPAGDAIVRCRQVGRATGVGGKEEVFPHRLESTVIDEGRQLDLTDLAFFRLREHGMDGAVFANLDLSGIGRHDDFRLDRKTFSRFNAAVGTFKE